MKQPIKDIADLAASSRRVELTHPTAGKVGVFFDLIPATDPRAKAVERSTRDITLQQSQRGKKLQSAQLEENGKRIICARVIGWDWKEAQFAWRGKTEHDFSQANLREFFSDVPWAEEFIDMELGDDTAFFPK